MEQTQEPKRSRRTASFSARHKDEEMALQIGHLTEVQVLHLYEQGELLLLPVTLPGGGDRVQGEEDHVEGVIVIDVLHERVQHSLTVLHLLIPRSYA